ncbi:class I adenylate-forming enzyme family protein [Brevibacterium aurantiacum]|uniref:class I adenylate-forming enzyme family protein n=1 Tax=Brevibacterium aurantiacum TaxID=273384 RepID=UPI0001BC2B69|nr:AMP-binding protein [Brevibacterium aurantiacum]
MTATSEHTRTDDVCPFDRPDVPLDVCPLTTSAVLRRAATTVPDLEAVVCGDDRVTYAELERRVADSTAVLERLGIRPGDHVALCVGNGPRWVELFYAITGIGAVVVAVNTRYRSSDLAHVLNDSQATYLITAPQILSSDFLSTLRIIGPDPESALPHPELPHLERIVVLDDDQSADFEGSWERWSQFVAGATGTDEVSVPRTASSFVPVSPTSTSLIQYTSGTTSRPKGVLLTHQGMCADAHFSAVRMGLRAGDRFHSVRPFFHVAGSTLSVLSSAQSMATLVTMERFVAGPALEVLEKERCTHFSGNDTIALMLLDHPDRSHRDLVLRGAWVAASAAVIRRVADELGAAEVVAGYGQSEASPNVAQSAWYEPAEVRLSAAMLPQPGVDVRIWDHEAHVPAMLGTKGEIQVRGWNVMTGYLNNPQATKNACTEDGWLRTGDLGTMDEGGRLVFVGRLKEMFRVGGENVSPVEIEEVLLLHPAVRQAVVVGVPDPRLIEVPFAFVSLAQGGSLDEDQLALWMRERVAGFKIPKFIHFVEDFEELGMTASSKIQRGGLGCHAKSIMDDRAGL